MSNPEYPVPLDSEVRKYSPLLPSREFVDANAPRRVQLANMGTKASAWFTVVNALRLALVTEIGSYLPAGTSSKVVTAVAVGTLSTTLLGEYSHGWLRRNTR